MSENQKENKLVSVIVPVYNVEKYLNQCINSLIRQTYHNIEIILVDDGSKDSSGEQCDKFSNIDVRIKVVHKANEGLGLARNSGLNVATGDFVTFIDSDDYADANMISELMEAIKKNNADVAIGGFERVNADGIVLYTEKYQTRKYTNKNVMSELFTQMLGNAPNKSNAIKMSVWNALFSMKIIRKYNIMFPSERQYISEDIIFASDFYPHVKCAVIVSSIAYKYRVNINSLTSIYRSDRFEKMTILYQELKRRLLTLNLSQNAILRLQKQTLANFRVAIRLEAPKYSAKNLCEARKSIASMCHHKCLVEIVSEYPWKQLGFKQRLFVFLLKKKAAFFLVGFAQVGIL